MNFNPDYVFVIGVGGTGGHLAAPLARLIAYHPNSQGAKVIFIDGDEFEEKNATRQLVGQSQIGLNKARAMVDLCAYQGLIDNIECKEDFISASTFIPMLRKAKSPMIVCSVDNDATRLAIINAIHMVCEGDFFFISPGNSDGTESVKGQTMYWGRIDGNNVGINPAEVYPNIENPQDSVPHKGSCALNAPSRPQLIAANFFAASITLAVIQNLLDGMLKPQSSAMFFNLRTLQTSAS
jgi:hypothetical protein